jgi:hypothetical protein
MSAYVGVHYPTKREKQNKNAKLFTPLYASFKDPGSFTGEYTISSSHKQNCQSSPVYIHVTIVYELKFLRKEPQ